MPLVVFIDCVPLTWGLQSLKGLTRLFLPVNVILLFFKKKSSKTIVKYLCTKKLECHLQTDTVDQMSATIVSKKCCQKTFGLKTIFLFDFDDDFHYCQQEFPKSPFSGFFSFRRPHILVSVHYTLNHVFFSVKYVDSVKNHCGK